MIHCLGKRSFSSLIGVQLNSTWQEAIMKKTYRVGILASVLTLFAGMAMACGVNCNDPTGVGKGVKVPVWHVEYCVIGPAGGPYTKIACQDPRAVHTAPTGNQAVCFLGSDGKIHWDYQWAVLEGKKFINRRVDGRWQPDWQ
ncbi:MAG: hypothetical protein V4606_05045 [Patescibacteria group bacterium]